jgi:hypothetical protein
LVAWCTVTRMLSWNCFQDTNQLDLVISTNDSNMYALQLLDPKSITCDRTFSELSILLSLSAVDRYRFSRYKREAYDDMELIKAIDISNSDKKRNPDSIISFLLSLAIYLEVGAIHLTFQEFNALCVKQLQMDSLGYLITDSIIDLGFFGPTTSILDESFGIYDENKHQSWYLVADAFSNRKFSCIADFAEFGRRLEDSLQAIACICIQIRCDLLTKPAKEVTHLLASLDIDELIFESGQKFNSIRDNRDRGVFDLVDCSKSLSQMLSDGHFRLLEFGPRELCFTSFIVAFYQVYLEFNHTKRHNLILRISRMVDFLVEKAESCSSGEVDAIKYPDLEKPSDVRVVLMKMILDMILPQLRKEESDPKSCLGRDHCTCFLPIESSLIAAFASHAKNYIDSDLPRSLSFRNAIFAISSLEHLIECCFCLKYLIISCSKNLEAALLSFEASKNLVWETSFQAIAEIPLLILNAVESYLFQLNSSDNLRLSKTYSSIVKSWCLSLETLADVCRRFNDLTTKIV